MKDRIIAIKMHNDYFEDVFCVSKDNIVDNIYIGRVENVKGDICFINFDNKKNNGIMKIKDTTYKSGDYVRCQVQRDECEGKGAVLSQEITLAGQYVILAEKIKGYKFSHRLKEGNIAKLKKELPIIEGIGFIVRRYALYADIKDIIREINMLTDVYKNIPKANNKILCLYKRNLIDILISQTDSYGYDMIINSDEDLAGSICRNYELYDRLEPMLDYYDLRKHINNLFAREVVLKDGAKIVFDFTEAMTVIDVNSGRDFGDINHINCVSASEIVRQIRLRNISGMIIIDFISQKGKPSNIIKLIKDELKDDRVRSKVIGLSDYSIIAINRKKRYNALIMQFYERCTQCINGLVKRKSFQCEDICLEVLNLYQQQPFSHILINADAKLYDELIDSARFYLKKLIKLAKIYIKKEHNLPKGYSISLINADNNIDDADLLQEAE